MDTDTETSRLSEVVVALSDGPEAASVLAVARRLAAALGLGLRPVHVPTETGTPPPRLTDLVGGVGFELELLEGDVVERLTAALEHPATAAMVVGSRERPEGPRPAGHVPLALIGRTARPVVVVPPNADPGRGLEEVLLPLDGSQDVTAAAATTVRLLRGSGARITVVHVFDPEHVPLFVDQPHHALPAWGREFLGRHVQGGEGGAELELRTGDAGEGVLDVVAASGADLVVLCWHGSLSAERARTVGTLLSRSHVPLLLLPMEDAVIPGGGERGHAPAWQLHDEEHQR